MAKKKRRADFKAPPGVKKKAKRERPEKAGAAPATERMESMLWSEPTEPAQPPPPSLHDQRMTKDRLGWRGDGLWHFPEYDVLRLVAEVKDFPVLSRTEGLRAKEKERRERIEQARKELLAA